MNKTKTVNDISIDELNQLMKTDYNLLVIDTLPKARYQQKHLAGALQACVFEVSFLDQVAKLCGDRNRAIVVYGVSDQTHDAKTAAEKLLRDGYTQVSVLTGGLTAWEAAGHPLEGAAVAEAEPPAAKLADGTFPVDTASSVIEWVGRNPSTTHRGTLRLSSGEVRIAAGQIKGDFTIDMNSIDNLNLAGNDLKPVLEAHLKSDDFFYVKQFPTATFELTATPNEEKQPVSAPNYEVAGKFKLRGISAWQHFPATILPTDDGRVTAEAHFDLDRTRWGVIYGSTKFFEHLGMHLVFDQISLQLRIMTGSTEKGPDHDKDSA